jgi:2-polyprenyl-6-methoxyphenol hydroxylase-like FAD-dependent oxidoreductase
MQNTTPNAVHAQAGHAGHVLVIGGGIGGLALAQGLKKSGVSVAVFERDCTVTSRLQGYRVHINPAGSRALHQCLPAPLFDTFTRNCGRPGRAMRFLTERMTPLLTLDGAIAHPGEGVAQHRSVSRITLRQVLLSGLDDVVRFGKTFMCYERRADGRIVAQFKDGTTAEGDILVAADGGGSRVRRQFLPDAERIDTGVVAIAGKVFLDTENRRRVSPLLLDGLGFVSAAGGVGLFVALQELDKTAPLDRIGRNDETAAPHGSHFDNSRSYLMWALSARRQTLGLDAGAEAPGSDALRGLALRVMDGWSDDLKNLVRLTDADTMSVLPIRTSVPVRRWDSSNVTLIGDAIHAMTPYRGIGANIALKDAVRLCDALVAADRGERDIVDAIHAYETDMMDYGFKAVRNSLAAMKQMIDTGPVGLAASRAAFRMIDRLPPVKRWMFRRMGEE